MLVNNFVQLSEQFPPQITDEEADNVHTLQDALDVLFVKIGPED